MFQFTEVHYTPRELEVIKLTLQGNSRRKTAFNLDIADGTVDGHFKKLYTKTGSHCIEDLIIFLLSDGFEVNRASGEVKYKGALL